MKIIVDLLHLIFKDITIKTIVLICYFISICEYGYNNAYLKCVVSSLTQPSMLFKYCMVCPNCVIYIPYLMIYMIYEGV